MEKGSIIRTSVRWSRVLSFFPRGIREGSQSGGKYLFSTLRSPMVGGRYGAALRLGKAKRTKSDSRQFGNVVLLVRFLFYNPR